jgi:hypothetical protein
MVEFAWLPKNSEWQKSFKQLDHDGGLESWQQLRRLAGDRLTFTESLQLDRAYLKRFTEAPPPGLTTRPIRLAVLGSSTTNHLSPGIRLGALRRNIWMSIYTPAYGQFFHEILDTNSSLHRFQPDAVLFALDANYLLGDHIRGRTWRLGALAGR